MRSEIALDWKVARNHSGYGRRRLVMTEYNDILQEVMKLQFPVCQRRCGEPGAENLNTFNLKTGYNKDHLIICIGWTYGSGRRKRRFKLTNKLKINFYDAEIFEAVLKRLEAEKDSV